MTVATYTTAKTTTGLLLPCPCCDQAEASIALELSDMQSFTCRDCDAEFTRDDVTKLIAKWSRLFTWLDTAPPAE